MPTKKPKTPEAPKPEQVPVLLRLIRARMRGRPARDLTTGAGIAYSRAHGLLNTTAPQRHLENLEAALEMLAPELMKKARTMVEKAEAGEKGEG